MAAHRDPWAILDVPRSATDAEIKRAYRKLARELHPDRNPGDAEKAARFQEVAAAYDSIQTAVKRDQWLGENEGMRAAASGPFQPFGAPDPFEEFTPGGFGAPGSGMRRDAERDIQKSVTITFADSFQGTELEMPLEVEEACTTCGGSGAAPGHKPRQCGTCRGSGSHSVGAIKSPCGDCQGRGYTIDMPCHACDQGLVRLTRNFVIPIPAGVEDGQVIRVPGAQRGRLGGPDVVVTVKVEPSKVFKRTLADRSDLLIVVPINYSEACLGAEVKVPTPEKVIALRVPAGTPNGKAFRIPGKGMTKPDGGRGDLYARMQVVVPARLSGPQRKLIQQLHQYDDPNQTRAELFSGLREN